MILKTFIKRLLLILPCLAKIRLSTRCTNRTLYLFLIRSVKYDYLRKVKANYKRQPLLVNEYIVEYNATLALNDIERSIIRKELTLAFKRSEVKLSRMERRIIRLLLNDYKPKEIAMVLNLESKVVYNAIQRSKCKLKRSFE